MPRVFLLDPAYPESVTPGFLRHATERAGWDIVRPQFFQAGVDGARWFADFEKGLAEAQILVGLGDFMGLMQWGARLDEALGLLRRKIDDGTPLLLSGTSSVAPMLSSARSETTDVDAQIRDFLGSYGIHITGIKVASRIKEVRNYASDLCCVFHSEDDDLIDPQLFNGVDKVVAYGNRLISYDAGIFPIIEACRALHFLQTKAIYYTEAILARGTLSRCFSVTMEGAW